MDELAKAVSAYQSALDQIPPGQEGISPVQVMETLLARDRLAAALARSESTAAANLTAITALDQRLQAAAQRIEDAVGRPTLVAWRDSLQPPASAWWWRLDERLAASQSPPHPGWTVAAGFCITVAISLAAEIARRFLAVGPDFVGVFSTIVQGLLALLAGRSLTASGRQSVEKALAAVGVARKHGHVVTTGMAALLLLAVVALRLSLPAIAHRYNDQGVRSQQSGRVTSAILDYQRAISLSPNYAEAHYNLGTAYEDILAYDPAIVSYQTALRSDARMFAAYNNLARVYMLHRNDFGNALALLDTALDLKLDLAEPQLSLVRYSLLKNRGWANFGLRYLTLAEADLRQALELRPDGAAAHCLLAQVLEAQDRNADALPHWEDCVRYATSDVVPVEARWVGLARERLNTGGAP